MIPGWTVTQMNHVRMWADSTPAEVLARQVRKPKDEVEQILVRLNIKPVKPIKLPPRRQVDRKVLWTKDKDAILIAKYPTTDRNDLAKELGVTPRAITKRASRLKLKKQYVFKWTPERESTLIEMWAYAAMPEMVKEVGCCTNLIWRKARELGLPDRRKEKRISLKQLNNLRSAGDHLRSGDHITALDIIEEILK